MSQELSIPEIVRVSIYNSDDGKRWYAYVLGRPEVTARGKGPGEVLEKLEKQAQKEYDVPIDLRVSVESVKFPNLMTLKQYGEWAQTRERCA